MAHDNDKCLHCKLHETLTGHYGGGDGAYIDFNEAIGAAGTLLGDLIASIPDSDVRQRMLAQIAREIPEYVASSVKRKPPAGGNVDIRQVH